MTRLTAALLAPMLVLACKKTPAPQGSPPRAPVAAITVAAEPEKASLTPDELALYNHGREGSEVLPYFLMKVMKNGDQPFEQDLERFGLLTDDSKAKNAEGLPVGVAVDVPADLRWANLRMFGFNCAACHTGELTAGGKTVRVVGGPGRFDPRRFFGEYGNALVELIKTKAGVRRALRALYDEVTRAPADPKNEQSALLAKQLLAAWPSATVPTPMPPFWRALDVDLEMIRTQKVEGDALATDPLWAWRLGQKPPSPLPENFAARTLAPGLLAQTTGLPEPLRSAQGRALMQSVLEDFAYVIRMLKARAAFANKLASGGGGAPR